MSKFDEAKKKFSEASDEDKAGMILASFAVLFLALLLIALVWVIVESMLPYLLGAIVLYALGTKFFGWPIPKFVKKLFK